MKKTLMRLIFLSLIFIQGSLHASMVIEEKMLYAKVVSNTFLGYHKYEGFSESFFDGDLIITLTGLHVDKKVCALNIFSKKDKAQLTKGNKYFDVKDIQEISAASANVFTRSYRSISSSDYTYSIKVDPLLWASKVTCQVTVLRAIKNN